MNPNVVIDAHEEVRSALSLLHDDACPCNLSISMTELLPGWYDDWVLVEREMLRQVRLHALEALAQRLLGAGRFGLAVEVALNAVRQDPLRESAHRTLIEIYRREGNYNDAVRQYELCRDLFRARLAIDPSDDLRQLAIGRGLVEARRVTTM